MKGQGSRAPKRVDSDLPYNVYKGFGLRPPNLHPTLHPPSPPLMMDLHVKRPSWVMFRTNNP